MKISGKAYFARVNEDYPDEKYDPCWKITVVVGKDERNRVTEATGVKFSRCDGDEIEGYGEYHVAIRRNVYKKLKGKFTTTKNRAPKIYIDGKLTDKQPMTANGSEVTVEFSPYNWTYKGGKGVSLDLNAVNFTKLIEYIPDDEEGADTQEDTKEAKDETVNELEDTTWDSDEF